jgi:AbrB family looped-hinge helix DNA binding protein
MSTSSKSTITSKNQTTVPKEVRERLGMGPGDVLLWDVVDQVVQVRAADPAFLKRRGSIHVGPGSAVEDVRRARRLRGREGV